MCNCDQFIVVSFFPIGHTQNLSNKTSAMSGHHGQQNKTNKLNMRQNMNNMTIQQDRAG